MSWGFCSVCDGHGVLVTFVKGAWQASPCPVCAPFVSKDVEGVSVVTSPYLGEMHVIKHGVLQDVPWWFAFGGEDGG